LASSSRASALGVTDAVDDIADRVAPGGTVAQATEENANLELDTRIVMAIGGRVKPSNGTN